MFLNFLKNFSIKKNVKKSLSDTVPDHADRKIHTVGLLIDETHFIEKEALIKKITDRGIALNQVQILVYREKKRKSDVYLYPTFTRKDIGWKGKNKNESVATFIAQEFDMLISYYDTEKAPLLYVTNASIARFKVGFSTVDKRLNHFMIHSNVENYKVFTEELFKYLKILNKI